jgi:glycogen operon protein
MTSDDAINELRSRQCRNLLATLILSQGVPMLLAGDEIGRTQRGNNNAYCQDNDTSWVDWEHGSYDLFTFVEKLIALRLAHPVFRRRQFILDEIGWYRNDGERMTAADWNTPWAKAVGMHLSGSCSGDSDNDFYLAFNAHYETVEFRIPRELGSFWRVVLHTACHPVQPVAQPKGTTFCVEAYSLVVAARLRMS